MSSVIAHQVTPLAQDEEVAPQAAATPYNLIIYGVLGGVAVLGIGIALLATYGISETYKIEPVGIQEGPEG